VLGPLGERTTVGANSESAVDCGDQTTKITSSAITAAPTTVASAVRVFLFIMNALRQRGDAQRGGGATAQRVKEREAKLADCKASAVMSSPALEPNTHTHTQPEHRCNFAI
jgi:hypothetical protein